MDSHTNHIMTLTNSIIGVSILAMPYCFKQCGIILSAVMLLISNIISRLSCHFLLKSAIIARTKTFEFLAFHIFGALGKFVIEIGLIGFLVGTCVAFFVVMGDLGPEIISEMTQVRTNSTMRTSILIILAAFCVLPLGLLRNVDSLSAVSKATVGFYCCLVLKIVIEAISHIFSSNWMDNVVLWRPDGILQCLPIFSMALSCQTQLFEIYQVLPNCSLEKMNSLIKMAVNICTWVYIFVGTFGYIAFFNTPFTGNILLSFRPSIMTDVMKIGFILSLAFSFPLVILPCRASLYSLLYKGNSYTLFEGNTNYIPEGKFKLLTILIVCTSLIIGIIIPNIELVLGLVGSTIGVMICVLFPVTCFICIIPKNTNERVLAQLMLFTGVIIMVLGTYANLYAFEEAKLNSITEKYESVNNNNIKIIDKDIQEAIVKQIEHDQNVMEIPTTIKQLPRTVNIKKKPIIELPINKTKSNISNEQKLLEDVKEVRHEPPQPEEPMESQISVKSNNKDDNIPNKIVEANEMNIKTEKSIVLKNNVDKKIDVVNLLNKQEIGSIKPVVAEVNNQDLKRDIIENIEEIRKEKEPPKQVTQKENLKKNDEVDIEAIKKEDTELKEQEKESLLQNKDTNQVLIDTIQKQNEVQKEIVEQQKKLIEVIQKQQENKNSDNNNNDQDNIDKFNEVKLNAVKQIENIAKKAIESISNQDGKKNIELNEENQKEIIKQVENKILSVNNEMKLNLSVAPLIYQSGLNREEKLNEKNNKNSVNLLPLPIVKANNLSLFDTIKKNNTISNNIEMGQNINDNNMNKIEKSPNLMESKEKVVKDVRNVISRDILSENEKPESVNNNNNKIGKSSKKNGTKLVTEEVKNAVSTDILSENEKAESVNNNNNKTGKSSRKHEINVTENVRNAVNRDILSENEDNVIRQKREASTSNSSKDNLKKDTKNTCEEINKLMNTKKPIVLHKLSEPDLIDINLNDLEMKNFISLKPQDKLISEK